MPHTVLAVLVMLSATAACSAAPDAEPSAATTTSPAADTVAPGSPTIGSEQPDSTSPDSTSPDSSDAPDTRTPSGFERVGATVTARDGAVCELCLWLADTAELRSQGLMSVTDLGQADGMAFVYPTRHTGTFWMKDTVLPLSIAFFGVGGAYVDAFDMEPCTADPCGHYPTPRDFMVAVETVQGGLSDLGIEPGSVLELTDVPCDG